MTIDRADRHWYDAERVYRERTGKTELTEEQQNEVWSYAADHIGLFLRWMIDNGFVTDADIEDSRRVRSGEMSGTDYLMNRCDGKLCEEDLCDDIIPFVNEYYNRYIREYEEIFTCYMQLSGDKEYNLIRPIIDKAYENFTNK